MNFRVGIGYDAHRLVEGRPLVLGGVTIPFEKGLEGHSDADALAHALCDAVLGAAALGDIGRHFPDTDPKWKGADSMLLLKECVRLAVGKGYDVVNADAVIVAQAPRMAPHIPAMLENLARVMGVEKSAVNVKAKTTETMGFEGRGEGISTQAVVTLKIDLRIHHEDTKSRRFRVFRFNHRFSWCLRACGRRARLLGAPCPPAPSGDGAGGESVRWMCPIK